MTSALLLHSVLHPFFLLFLHLSSLFSSSFSILFFHSSSFSSYVFPSSSSLSLSFTQCPSSLLNPYLHSFFLAFLFHSFPSLGLIDSSLLSSYFPLLTLNLPKPSSPSSFLPLPPPPLSFLLPPPLLVSSSPFPPLPLPPHN